MPGRVKWLAVIALVGCCFVAEAFGHRVRVGSPAAQGDASLTRRFGAWSLPCVEAGVWGLLAGPSVAGSSAEWAAGPEDPIPEDEGLDGEGRPLDMHPWLPELIIGDGFAGDVPLDVADPPMAYEYDDLGRVDWVWDCPAEADDSVRDEEAAGR